MSRMIPLALALALAVPTSAFGQEGEAYKRGQLYEVSTWSIDPAQSAAFEAAVKMVVEAAGQAKTPYRWVFWQDGSQYTLVFPIDNYAYFDDPEQFMRSFTSTPGEAQMQEAMGKFQEIHIETLASEIVELKDDWSYKVEAFDMSTMAYGHMDVMWPKPGMSEEFDELNKEWVAFFKDLGYPYPYDGHTVHHGKSGRVVYVTFIDNLSDYHGKNSLMKLIEAKNMSERWKELGEKFGAATRRWEHHDELYRRDLSYWPTPESATN